MMQISLFFAMVTLTSLLTETASVLPAIAPDLRRPKVRPFQVSTLCLNNRVMAAPDGQAFALWPTDGRYILGIRKMLPPNNVILGKMHDPPNAGLDKFITYGGSGLRLYPIRWSRNGNELYIRVREPRPRVLTVNSTGSQLDEAILATQWSLVDIRAISHGDIRLLSSPPMLERVGRIDGNSLIRGQATFGSTVELLGVRAKDLGLVRVEQQQVIDIGVSSGQTRLLMAFQDSRNYRYGVSYLGAARQSDRRNYRPYQLPVTDLSTGRVVGQFAPTEIHLAKRSRLGTYVKNFNDQLRAAGGIIQDVSVSAHTLFALSTYGDGRQVVTRVSSKGISEKLICAQPSSGRNFLPTLASIKENVGTSSTVRPRIFSLGVNGRESEGEGSPVLVHYSVNSQDTRDAVVYFHGGPGGSVLDETWLAPALRLLRPNRDVIAVEYAGSVGGGLALTRRLATKGIKAFNRDADRLAAWLATRRYRKIFVLAGSFGSVPAMITQARHRSLVSASFHIAPLLKLQEPQEWTTQGAGFHAVNANTQLAYELAYLGGAQGRLHFASELISTVARAELGSTDHLYFGEIDEISKTTHLPPSAKPVILSFPRTNHAVLSGRADLWRDIEYHMK